MSQSKSSVMGAVLLCVLGLCMATSGTVCAQEQNEADEIDGPLKTQLQEYWSVERDLDVVKGRLYTRKSKVVVGLQGGVMPSEQFYVYYPVGLRVGYFLSDAFGIEVSGNYAWSTNTDLTDFLEGDQGRGEDFNPSTDAEDKFSWRASAVVTWHPLYGKWALLQRKLSHFDVNFLAGVSVVGIERPDSNRLGSRTTAMPNLVLGMGLNLFLTKDVTANFEVRGHIHPGPSFTTSEELSERNFITELKLPTELLLGFSYAF